MSSSGSESAQTPAIRSFQMDGTSQGNLSSSVNLFRGDVNLTQNLFTLPGRSQGNGLDVAVTIQYQSNVFRAATTWNADAPTGVLGLGWDLPLTRIEATDGGSPSPDQRRYALYDNGAPNALIEQPVRPVLFTMDTAFATGLRDGATVPAAVRDAFLAHGLALSSDTRVEGSGPWTLADDAGQQLFELRREGVLEARDGGRSYQLRSYDFWKVLYYERYERWVVVTDEAMRRSFGGRGPARADGSATARGDSVAWSVWWTDGGDAPAWTGASAETAGQVQVARAWYLAEVADRFGNATTYTYAPVEQHVGDGGLPYTKAIALSSVVDVFGRTTRFSYGEKLWSAEPTAPREYHDPHRAVPSDAPGPYQDRYDTRFLERIAVTDASDATMFSIRFDYQVANVTASEGALAGDTYKRFLAAVVQLDQDGVSSPGLRFAYDLADDTEGGQPGALLSVTYPQGGVARYTYLEQELTLCERTLPVDRPAGVQKGATPRVFYGDDYVVACWYNQNTLQLSMQILTWTGVWLSWQADPASAVLDTDGLDLATLEVLPRADFLALTFRRNRGDRDVYLFERDAARPGQWRPATVDGVVTAPDRPTLSYPADGATVRFSGGSTFFVVDRMSATTLSGSYDVLTWRWSTGRWERERFETSTYAWVTAAGGWYAVLDAGSLRVRWLDGVLAWQDAATAAVSGLLTTDPASVALVPGAAMVAIANLQSSNAQQNTTRLWIAQWDAAMDLDITPFDAVTDWFGSGNPALPWVPQLVGDTLLGLNGNLFRRDGTGWSRNAALNPGANPPAHTSQRYAYGTDYAIRVLAPLSGVGAATASVLAFDPTRSPAWVGPTPIGPSLPPQVTTRENWPSAGPDWAVIGPFAWFRGTSTDWGRVVSGDATFDLQELVAQDGAIYVSESLVDEAPTFLAFTVDGGRDLSVQAVVLANGAPDGAPVPFDDEKLYAPSLGGVGGQGVSPAGPGLFVAFPAKYASLDEAQEIRIHRYAGQAVDGPVTHYTVTRVEMDDGFGDPIPTAFAPDPTTAAADATGDIVKFYENTVYPGTDDPAHPVNGRVVNRFLNGALDQSGDNAWDMLDGMLVRTETWTADGAMVESSGTTWTVLQQIASSPTDPAAPPVQLRGGWVVRTAQTSAKDGVTSVSTEEYGTPELPLPFTGQPAVQTLANVDGSGVEEKFTRVMRYGVEVYPELVAIGALTDVAQVATRRSSGGVVVPAGSNATTYTTWPGAAGALVAAPEAGFGLLDTDDVDFPYADYRPGDVPRGWQLVARTTHRGPYGQETANIDALGARTTILFDAAWEMAVARVANTGPAGCAYTGFQSYEDPTGWTLEGVRYDDDDAFTGTRSAVLPGGALVAVTVAPERAETWLVGCRYRTPAGFAPDGSGLRAEITVDGSTEEVELPWAPTDERWVYVTLPVPIPSGTSLSVRVSAQNTTDRDVHLDAVLVCPLVSGATLRTFDPDSQQVLSSMDAGGRTSRTAYDRGYRAAVSIGALGQVREISASFQSRQGSPDGTFDPESPNAELTVHAADGGTLESFRDGALWATRWVPDAPSAWKVADGGLTYAGGAPATLRWAEAPQDLTYAVYVEPQPGDGSVLRLTAGDIEVAWDRDWTARQGGAIWPALAKPPQVARRWLLVVGRGVVLFFGDGQLLFSVRTTPGAGPVTLVASGGPVTLRNLTGARDVRVGLSYNDAGGRQRQVHQLHGDDSLLCERVYDALDRPIATTRSAPGRFGSGERVPTLGYRPGFLDVRAFLEATATTWEMQGDVAEYYRGQSEDGVRRPDDQGYPYWANRYERSQRSVKLETALPGKPYAIDLTVPAADRATLQFAYGANDGVEPALPEGQYATTTVTSPVKTVSTALSDKLGAQVSTLYAGPDGSVVSCSAGTRAYDAPASGPVATLVQQLPNALVPGPQSEDAAFVRLTTANALQDTESIREPDAGETRFVLDAAGNLRFVRPAMDPGEAWYIYYRYDAVGRMVEEGTVEGEWLPEALRDLANDPSWPRAGTEGVFATVVTTYDGPGDDPALIGMKWRAITLNAEPALTPGDGACGVVETFGYDEAGHLVEVRQEITGAVEATGTIRYAYDALAQVIRVDLPDGCPIASLHYTYDDQGDVVAVGTTPGGDELGAFTFTPDRQPRTQACGVWTRVFEYTSPGWIASLVTTAGDQRHDIALSYEPDGAMSRRAVTSAFAGYSGAYADTFGYDEQRRLASAVGSSDVHYTRYDANGNLWALTHRGEEESFTCVPGGNRLASVALGGPPMPLVYDAQGRMVSGLGRELDYDDATGMTTAIVQTGAALRLAYGSAQQRVVKKDLGSGSERVYLAGAGQRPIATRIDGAWAVTVYGPTGFLGWVTADGTSVPLTDPTGTVWAVVSGESALEVATYLPFGLSSTAFGQAGATPYGFQGQEVDPEVGLYNFRTRLYDPSLRRFLTPDPQRQLASPYVFAGNDPLTVSDPTGELSLWAQVGIGAALVAVTALGIGLTLFTGGASDAAAASVDATILTTAGIAEGATAVEGGGLALGTGALAAQGSGGGIAAVAAVEGTVAAGAEGTGAGGFLASLQVAAGAWTAEATATSFSWTAFGVNTLGSTLIGAGVNGLEYDLMHGRDFTAKGFFESVGIGAASGFVSGAAGGALGPLAGSLTSGASAARQVLARGAAEAITGALSSDVKTVLTNVAQHQPWYQGLLKSTAMGAGENVGLWAGKSLGKAAWAGREAIGSRAGALMNISDAKVQKVLTLPEVAKAAATTDAAIASYVVAGFFIPAGYAVWGAATLSK